MNQTELLGSVRKGIEAAQAVATTRLETLEDDARKVLSGLVEKGRDSQRNLTERVQKIAESEAVRNRVRPVENAFRRVPVSELRGLLEKRLDELSRRFDALRTNTRGRLATASRDQLQALVRELRRIADRLASLTDGAEQAVEQAQAEEAKKEAVETSAATTEPSTSAPAADTAPAASTEKAEPKAKKAAAQPRKTRKKASKAAPKASAKEANGTLNGSGKTPATDGSNEDETSAAS